MTRQTPYLRLLTGAAWLGALAGCGMHVAKANAGAAGEAGASEASGVTNELELHTAGGYSVDLSTGQVRCQRRIDDQIVELTFHQGSGSAAGLDVRLAVTGDFAAEDAGAVRPPQGVDFRLQTPAGDRYAFSSAAAQSLAAGTLSLTRASRFVAAGNIRLDNVASPSRPASAIAVHGSFLCRMWD